MANFDLNTGDFHKAFEAAKVEHTPESERPPSAESLQPFVNQALEGYLGGEPDEEFAASVTQGILDHANVELAAKESQTSLADFSQEFPDWKQHERRMLAVGQKMLDNGEVENLDSGEFLERCYFESLPEGSSDFNWQHELRKVRLAMKAKGESQ
jgi:hypothetical protein